MAYEISDGTSYPHATDHADLLTKLELFASANGWTVLESYNSVGVSPATHKNDSTDKLVLQSDITEVIIAFQKYSGGGNVGWHQNVYTGFNPELDNSGNTQTFFNQPGAIQDWHSMPLINASTPYWFVVNDRRIVVIAHVDTTYQQCYMGLFLPYASPGQWPYPAMIGSSFVYGNLYNYSSANIAYSSTTNDMSAFWRGIAGATDGSKTTCAVLLPNGVWTMQPNSWNLQTDWASVVARGMFPYCAVDPNSGFSLANHIRTALGSETQTITLGAGNSSGTWTITFSGQTTSALNHNASAGDVQTALEALSNIAPGDVSVGLSGLVYTVAFGGAYADTNLSPMTTTPSLVGGANTATVATTISGAPSAILPIEYIMSGEIIPQTFGGNLGTLDGVYYITGQGHTAGSTVTIGATDYLLVPNIFRTSTDNRAAIELS